MPLLRRTARRFVVPTALMAMDTRAAFPVFPRSIEWGLFALLFASLLVVGCSSSESTRSPSWRTEDGYLLQLRLDEGRTYVLETTMDQTMTMGIRGQSMDMEQTQTMSYRYEVQEVAEDGTISLDYTMTRVQGKTSMPAMGQSMSYDTADTTSQGQAAQMNHRMRAMTGHPVTARLSPNGSVQAVTGVEALFDSLTAAQEDSMQVRLMRRMLGPEGVRQQLNLAFNIYPDRPVTVGDTWSTQSSIRVGVPMQVEATYTLDSLASETAFLDTQMELKSGGEDEQMQMGGMAMDLDLNGSMDGTIRLDLPSGLPTESTMEVDVSGEGSVQGGQSAQGMSMQMDLESKGTVTTTIQKRGEGEESHSS